MKITKWMTWFWLTNSPNSIKGWYIGEPDSNLCFELCCGVNGVK